MIDALSIAILVYDAEFKLIQQNPKAVELFNFSLNTTLAENFGDNETRGTLRRLQRGHSPSFTIEHTSGILIEFLTSHHEGTYILQGFPNKSLQETQLLLNNYSTRLEKQNHKINTLLDETLWLQVSIQQALRPIFMVDTQFRLQFMNTAAKRIFMRHHRTFGQLIPEILTEEPIGLSLARLPIFEDIGEQRSISQVFTLSESVFESHAIRVLQDETTIGFCVELEDVTQKYSQLKERARLQDMVEGMGQATMLCDETGTIRYMNPSCMALLIKEASIFQTIDSNDTGLHTIIGTHITDFLRDSNPPLDWDAHQNRFKTFMPLTQHTFAIDIHRLTDDHGRFSGYVLEWTIYNIESKPM